VRRRSTKPWAPPPDDELRDRLGLLMKQHGPYAVGRLGVVSLSSVYRYTKHELEFTLPVLTALLRGMGYRLTITRDPDPWTPPQNTPLGEEASRSADEGDSDDA
jgi:hypothetical protein